MTPKFKTAPEPSVTLSGSHMNGYRRLKERKEKKRGQFPQHINIAAETGRFMSAGT